MATPPRPGGEPPDRTAHFYPDEHAALLAFVVALTQHGFDFAVGTYRGNSIVPAVLVTYPWRAKSLLAAVHENPQILLGRPALAVNDVDRDPHVKLYAASRDNPCHADLDDVLVAAFRRHENGEPEVEVFLDDWSTIGVKVVAGPGAPVVVLSPEYQVVTGRPRNKVRRDRGEIVLDVPPEKRRC